MIVGKRYARLYFVRSLPNPGLLVRPALSREAASTSALEGTYAPLSEVFAGDHVDEHRQSAEVREILNYAAAARLGLDLIRTLPISFSLAAKLQKRLVRGTRGDQYDAGERRERNILIGDRGRGVERSRFVPPPPGEELAAGISEWEKWINAENEVPFVARLALEHYQFETLHPFSDGNGRIGRLLIALQLVAEHVLEYPVLNISTWLEPRRDEYIDHLLAVSVTGDYDAWVEFFATGVRDQAVATARTVARLTTIQQSLVDRVLAENRKGVIVELARDLIGMPVLSVNEVRDRYEIAYPSARSVVRQLEEFGILREVSGRNYRKIYVCHEVYDVVADSSR